MKRYLAALILLIPAALAAQTLGRPKVYFDPADPFSNAFAAGLEKKQVPVLVTTDAGQADYVVEFAHGDSQGSKARGITTAVLTGVYADGSFNRTAMRVVDVKTKTVIFSYTCQKGGHFEQSTAECLAKHWKQHIEKK